ncbi:MAG: AbrB/MazE/SpoVT family DNA-binding domain-containing protein [Oculatellaceae cyanobacterium Prado106]|jgi:AbrB family looped-hinge helix DNA binding protein|nr:AbrB/MazE/SpoVT family DNA-binding domain-containing protein [Oculatellaceae cyanobacterium Prado106]
METPSQSQSSTVSDEGQILLPEAIREHLKLQPGSRVEFVIDASGEVKLLPLNYPVTRLAGILYRADHPPVSMEEMDQAIQEHLNAGSWR